MHSPLAVHCEGAKVESNGLVCTLMLAVLVGGYSMQHVVLGIALLAVRVGPADIKHRMRTQGAATV